MIPREKIDEIKARASIVQVISDYIPLTKRGANHFGLCPFHSEKTPSFSVNQEKKIYYCFGCNEAGNVITFVMKKEGVSFPEAVTMLGRKFGVSVEAERKEVSGFKESIFGVNNASVQYFLKEIDSPEGGPAREYLKKRGYGDGNFLRSFNVGFAPERWEGLTRYLRENGIPPEVAEKAGVIVKREGKGFYDRFRGRIIFPITDIKGRVVGFGGRTMGDGTPKYLNSPETLIFKKGEALFGLPAAKEGIVKEGYAIVVEGYFDLLALHQNGFKNSVATMGTALTPGHLRALKGYAHSIYTLFDTDDAGKGASLRALTLSLDEGMPMRVVTLNQGKDPDELLRAGDRGPVLKAIEGAEPVMEFFLRELTKKFHLRGHEGKAAYLEATLPYLQKMGSVAERDHYISKIASIIGIPPNSIYEALKARAKAGASASYRGVVPATNPKVAGISGVYKENPELVMLRVLLKHPELWSPEVSRCVDAFTDEALKEAGSIMCRQASAGNVDFEEIVESLKGTEHKVIIRELFVDGGFIEEPKNMLEDCLKKVLNRGKLKDTTLEVIKRLEESGKAGMARKIRERAEKG